MNDVPGNSLIDAFNKYVVGTTQDERLLRFSSPLGEDRLLAHRFYGHERLGRVPAWTVDLISYDANIDEHDLIGHPVSLAIRLEDGSESYRHGLVRSLTYLGADGGLHDWQIVFVPWFALLGYREDCRIWMDTSIVDVLTDIFTTYPEAHGRYRFDLRQEYPAHTYLSQINETDENFVQRWCEQEGIYWYTVHEADQHTVVFTDDIATLPASSRQSIRFHTQSSTQKEDSILQWRQQHALHSSRTHYASRDYRSHQHPLVDSENAVQGSTSLEALERYAYKGQYAWNSPQYGNRLLRVKMEQQESAGQRIHAISGARRLTAGEWFELRDHPLVDGKSEEQRQFTVIGIEMFAESNLPIATQRRDSPGSLGALVREFRKSVDDARSRDDQEQESPSLTYGFYLSRLECQRHDIPYRSPEEHKRPEVGLQTGVVVTPPGSEVYTDKLNRIHVRFNWDRLSSDDALSSCWLRVMQHSSGPDWGAVYIPRAGEEVLIGFMDNHLDRPVVLGQLYGSHQPQWHSTGLMSGLKSKEVGGRGHNQLVMDDSTGQVRTQLASTEAETQLNLGYLIDQQGNHRGALRGNGFELRTDAYGAIRARDGLYLSTWGQPGASGAQLEAEDAWSQLRAAHELSRTLSEVASQHTAEALTGVDGLGTFNRNGNVTYGDAASASGGEQRFEDGGGDTQHAINSGGKGKVPGLNDALVLVSSPDGIATATPKSTHLHSGEHLTLSTGEDISIGSGKGLLASVADKISLFVHRAGMKLIAAGGRVDIQAQQDEMELLSKQAMRLSSTENAIILAGKKEILLTSGDAYIRLAGGDIQIHAPKTVDIKGAKKSISGPASMSHTFNQFPESRFNETFRAVKPDGTPVANMPYEIRRGEDVISSGVTDADGRTSMEKSEFIEGMELIFKRNSTS